MLVAVGRDTLDRGTACAIEPLARAFGVGTPACLAFGLLVSATMRPHGITEASREALGLEALRRRGFEASFTADGGRLRVSGSERTFEPEAVPIVDYCRFEGTSDPDDSAVIYALEAPDGTRGVLVDAYGAYADPAVGALLDRMPVTRRRRGTRRPKLVASPLAIAAGCTAMALVALVLLRRRGANVAREPEVARRPNLARRCR